MIQISAAAIKADPQIFSWRLNREEMDLDNEAGIVGQCDVELSVYRFQSKIFIQGVVYATIEQTCSRCLEPFAKTFETKAEWVAVPDGMEKFFPEQGDDEEKDPTVISFSRDHIDLTEEVRNVLLLALPMKPLCREDCAGLCSQCGQPLQLGVCRCDENLQNSPFGVLKKITFADTHENQ